ncbi:hypothetical protein EHE19_002480 [Ruminiclostridium herbifermentans]|uniref:Uncharacterized protein n=1 Tax=Ruminiclostridium herbifermentans TaxID=2488810 RepID=A0A4U7JHD9_9FIRM|nr:hypothetical protein EHE19_002480 [Ruminiclostridium herbifermentans]
MRGGEATKAKYQAK